MSSCTADAEPPTGAEGLRNSTKSHEYNIADQLQTLVICCTTHNTYLQPGMHGSQHALKDKHPSAMYAMHSVFSLQLFAFLLHCMTAGQQLPPPVASTTSTKRSAFSPPPAFSNLGVVGIELTVGGSSTGPDLFGRGRGS